MEGRSVGGCARVLPPRSSRGGDARGAGIVPFVYDSVVLDKVVGWRQVMVVDVSPGARVRHFRFIAAVAGAAGGKLFAQAEEHDRKMWRGRETVVLTLTFG
jgi:hypothetical protein